jgi:hypothetical protein
MKQVTTQKSTMLCLLMACATIIGAQTAGATPIDRYITTTGAGNGSGSSWANAAAPVNGLIDSPVSSFVSAGWSSGLIIHFGSGTFYTKAGINAAPYNGFPEFQVIGAGASSTFLVLADDTSRPNNNTYVIGTQNWCNKFWVTDLTINCDASAQTIFANSVCKIGGIYGMTSNGKVEHVRVTNFGAKGLSSEVFPLRLDTDNATNSYVEIRYCEVDNLLGNGYCTAIDAAGFGFVTPYVGHEDTQPEIAALIEFNHVHDVPNGIGLGCNNIHNVILADNIVDNASMGFNCDTYWTKGVTIMDNEFNFVGEGVSLGGYPEAADDAFTNFLIQNNAFLLTEPLSGHESYAVRLAGGHGVITVSGNSVSYDDLFSVDTYGIRALGTEGINFEEDNITSQWSPKTNNKLRDL